MGSFILQNIYAYFNIEFRIFEQKFKYYSKAFNLVCIAIYAGIYAGNTIKPWFRWFLLTRLLYHVVSVNLWKEEEDAGGLKWSVLMS